MANGIVITGGGSGGHVYPGIAVIEKLRKKANVEISWLGSNRGIEKKILQDFDVHFFSIPSGKFRRYFSFRNILDVIKILFGIIAACSTLLKLKPALLFSKGGFVTVPPVFAAKLLGIPVYSHESDLDPGLATRINARFSEKILIAYPESAKYLSTSLKTRIEVTGNPIREAIARGNPREGKKIIGCDEDKPILLVLGGSQGARQINRWVWRYLDWICRNVFVVHQYGIHEDEIPSRGGYFSKEYFNNEYPHILAASDLVLSRAGAGILWEIGARSKPAILIPLSGSGTRGDQVRNAEYFESRGAAMILHEERGEDEKLPEMIEDVIRDKNKLSQLGAAAGSLCPMTASDLIADIILHGMEVRSESVRN